MNPIQSGDLDIRTIRVADEQIGKILDSLDAGNSKAPGKRRSPRYAYRVKDVRVFMQSPCSAAVLPYLVPTRNLSEGGLSFLHGGFVHQGTRCLVQLLTTSGVWDDVLGIVVSCRYVEGVLHEVSVRFDRKIAPSAYCSSAIKTCVLLAEDSAAVSRLTKMLLESFVARVEIAENGRIAVEKAMKTAYDVILMDMEMPEMDGYEATRLLRQRGYSGRIYAVTGLASKDDVDRCLAAGCNKHFSKPVSKETLSEIVSSIREKPLASTLRHDPAMLDLIDGYVKDLPTKVRAVEEALSKQNAKAVEFLVRAMKSDGMSFGFAPISQLAATVEKTLIEGATLAEAAQQIDALIRLCLRAR